MSASAPGTGFTRTCVFATGPTCTRKRVVNLELEPGDLALWGLLTVHGSNANTSQHDRAFAIQSYVRASTSQCGEWAFRAGESIPLGPEPEVCKYEALREKPGPFYDHNKWFESADGS